MVATTMYIYTVWNKGWVIYKGNRKRERGERKREKGDCVQNVFTVLLSSQQREEEATRDKESTCDNNGTPSWDANGQGGSPHTHSDIPQPQHSLPSISPPPYSPPLHQTLLLPPPLHHSSSVPPPSITPQHSLYHPSALPPPSTTPFPFFLTM